jgi:hypothetical protein
MNATKPCVSTAQACSPQAQTAIAIRRPFVRAMLHRSPLGDGEQAANKCGEKCGDFGAGVVISVPFRSPFVNSAGFIGSR